MIILLVFAFVLFVIGAWFSPTLWEKLLCSGLACWVATQIFPSATSLFK